MGGPDCVFLLNVGVCVLICCQISSLHSGPTCQKVIKRAKSPDQCFLQKVY